MSGERAGIDSGPITVRSGQGVCVPEVLPPEQWRPRPACAVGCGSQEHSRGRTSGLRLCPSRRPWHKRLRPLLSSKGFRPAWL